MSCIVFITAHFQFIIAQMDYHCTLKLGMHTHNLETYDAIIPAKDTESSPQQSGSPLIQKLRQQFCETLDTNYGFLDFMGKIG